VTRTPGGASPPTAARTSPVAITLNWEQFQEEVGQSFPNIAPFLEMGRFLGIEGNVVTIGFTKQATVARAMLEKSDNIQALSALCERVSGQPVRLRVVELTESDPQGPTMAQIRAAKEQEQKVVLFERAKAHPMVKQALEIFGAELADVRTVSNRHEVQE
jgi:DNA polymerase-3 subunit gamma/tau